MKILLSAFACAPNVGSEGGVGWRWAMELARDHDVVLVTDQTRQAAIEAELAAHSCPRIQFVFYRPAWLKAVPLNSNTAQLLYSAWQFALLPFARQLHRQHRFDLAMHISYGVFRHPSFLGYLGIPFIFGPLGGGEDAPLALKRSIGGSEKLREWLRALVNKLALFDPFLWIAFAGTSLILVKTEDTRRALPWPFRKRAVVYPEIGIDAPADATPRGRADGEPLRVLFAGRLLGWKGAHLAIRAVAKAIRQDVNIEFTLVGRGPYEAELRRIASEEGISELIHWLSHVPQQDLFTLYRGMHCLLFPSLHDSSGNVVLEAQANGLPVICLDLGGPATLVAKESALVIPTQSQDEAGVISRLVVALQTLAGDEDRRLNMSQAALNHVTENMTWAKRVSGALALAEGVGRGN